MIIKNVRCDWVFLADTNKHGGYSVCALLPNNHPQLEDVKKAVEKARQKGIADGKFTEANTKSANFKFPLHDGDAEVEAEERPPLYKGHTYFNANNKSSQPGLVDELRQPLMDAAKLYSGAYYHLDVNFYPFDTKSKGVGAGLNNVMFVKDGDRLDGRQDAEEAFADIAVEDDLQ